MLTTPSVFLGRSLGSKDAEHIQFPVSKVNSIPIDEYIRGSCSADGPQLGDFGLAQWEPTKASHASAAQERVGCIGWQAPVSQPSPLPSSFLFSLHTPLHFLTSSGKLARSPTRAGAKRRLFEHLPDGSRDARTCAPKDTHAGRSASGSSAVEWEVYVWH